MTAITPTEREPLCDIEAQLRALLDPDHPKRAVWISRGTPDHAMTQFAVADGYDALKLDAGTLYASEHDCGRLADDPSEETLSVILDYTEPKSGIALQSAVWWPVVQARDTEGHVVWEQISSWARIGETLRRAILYGRPAVCTMTEVLSRRARLVAKEEADAQRLQGREGRKEAQGRVPE